MHKRLGGFGAVVLVVGLALFALVTFFVLKYSVKTNTTPSENGTEMMNLETTPTSQPVPTSAPLGDSFDSDSQSIDKKMNDLNTDMDNVDQGMNDKAIDVQ